MSPNRLSSSQHLVCFLVRHDTSQASFPSSLPSNPFSPKFSSDIWWSDVGDGSEETKFLQALPSTSTGLRRNVPRTELGLSLRATAPYVLSVGEEPTGERRYTCLPFSQEGPHLQTLVLPHHKIALCPREPLQTRTEQRPLPRALALLSPARVCCVDPERRGGESRQEGLGRL